MKKGQLFKTETVGDFIKHISISIGILFFAVIVYFYIYLPNATNHGDSVIVPELAGMHSEKLDSLLSALNLRFEISDSVFSEDFKPLEVIRQFPHAGSVVKPERKIYVSINRIHPPTVPLPALVEVSLPTSIGILKSNDLKLGQVILKPSPFGNYVLEMQVNGVKMEIGARVPKGTVVDLIVGDGAGPNDLRVNNFVGMNFKTALLMLSAQNLHQGDIIIPEEVDTTGIEIIVFRQKPKAGDSVRVGDPVNLWIGPRDYAPKDSIEIKQ